MKPCNIPTCPEPAISRGRCRKHQETKRTRSNYNTAEHRRWAQAVKRRDRFCVDPYGRHPGEKRVSQIADHIRPVKDGGGYALANGRGVCWSCHEYGKAHKGAATLPNIPRPRRPLFVVCGPPGAGKTTYVEEHKSDDDLVLDMDVLAHEFGKPLYDMSKGERRAVVQARNQRLWAFCADETEYARCWLIATAGTKPQRRFWAGRGARLVIVNPGREVCKQRIIADKTRPPKTHQERIEALDRWE
jgi:hypothetical protein